MEWDKLLEDLQDAEYDLETVASHARGVERSIGEIYSALEEMGDLIERNKELEDRVEELEGALKELQRQYDEVLEGVIGNVS